MKYRKKKKISVALQNKLSALEEKLAARGLQVHYDLLEAAGLKLKGGICKIKGEYHLFIDRRKSAAEKIETLEDYVDQPFPENIPDNIPEDIHQENAADDDQDDKEQMPNDT
jgi:hypothetical protein